MKNWDKWVSDAVNSLKNYVNHYNLKSVVLGFSGGIDSTVSAVICYLATKDLSEVTFIGRSLPIKNAGDDTSIANRLGKLLCDDFAEVNMLPFYCNFREQFYNEEEESKASVIADGNIMARLRMIYLYQLANHYKGIVIDTDNATEHELGFYTVHGDVGDYNVGIRYLWKHEIWELAEVLKNYAPKAAEVIQESINLQPTDGNTGGTDLDQIAPGMTYGDVDSILKSFENRSSYRQVIEDYGIEAVNRIDNRIEANYYKRYLPITPRNMQTWFNKDDN